MQKKNRILVTIAFFIVFALFTAAIMGIDVKPIGPENSEVGFSSINGMVRDLLGTHLMIYKITEYFGYLCLLVVAGFAALGLVQLITRRSLWKVDKDILWLGGFYVLVLGTYVAFNHIVINYRPVILEEGLEPSYPSSHTMLAICVLGAAYIQFQRRVTSEKWRCIAQVCSIVVMNLVIIGRFVSGVHWFTDIIGGILLSGAYLALYSTIDYLLLEKKAVKSI